MSNKREFILYRWWDEAGNLLYVGKSVSVLSRISEHRRSSKFFPEAKSMTMERFSDAQSLAAGEVRAIRSEHPVFNVMHNSSPGRRDERPVPKLDPNAASHWEPVRPSDIRIGSVIRLVHDDSVMLQGIVDDELYECDECDAEGLGDDCEAWIVWADDGHIYYLHDWELDLYDGEAWVSLEAGDDTKGEMFSRWLTLMHERQDAA